MKKKLPTKIKSPIRAITKKYTVAHHPQAAELRQWLLRTTRTITNNGTNTKTRASPSSN